MFVKVDENKLFVKIKTEEIWTLVFTDYKAGKNHKVFADSKNHAWKIADRSYQGYHYDLKVKIISEFKNIVSGQKKTMCFDKEDGEEEFIKKHSNFSFDDSIIIMKYKELKQRERHHRETINTKYNVGRALEKNGRIQAGLPIDFC